MYTEADYALYCTIRQIADLVFAKLVKHNGSTDPSSPHDLWLEDRRGESVNPFYGQTSRGLFLEMYYGLPSTLHTPWGKWGFVGSGSGDFTVMVQDLLGELGPVYTASPKKITDMGEFGPVYSIKGLAQHLDPVDYLHYDAANDIWDEMTARYRSQGK